MEKVNITEGEWKVKEQGDANEYVVLLGKNDWIMNILQNGEIPTFEQRANMKLIEFSPKILKALQNMTGLLISLQFLGEAQNLGESEKDEINEALMVIKNAQLFRE